MDNNKLLSVQDLKVYFRGDEQVSPVLEGLSYDVRQGETVCLVGESGCGKTVSALTILGLIPRPSGQVSGGRVIFKEKNLLELGAEEMRKIRGNRISMVFQEPLTSLNPVFTIGDQIGEAISIHENISSIELRQRCIQLLKDVKMPSPEDRLTDYPHQLSGGQRQRVMIAMALACKPDLIIADEPTTALDVTIQAQILSLLRSLQKSGSLSILYITHDLGVVANIADRVFVMYAGTVMEQGETSQLFSDSCHPYTQGLLASLPNRVKRGTRLHSIPGTVPDPARRPSGCPFHPRCKHAVEDCQTGIPEMCDYGNGHLSWCPVLYEKG
ncbi:MAG: ABC transporter ATP-binding protein [Desulfobacterales bacterium]|nr:ABC transporter ATP-binding protein [Desulfobacterales bacterium]